MANWKTARQIADRYLVGEERLLAYSRRGNLACRRGSDGTMEFDEDAVARFFRPRGGRPALVSVPATPNLGVLGMSRLGDVIDSEATIGQRAARRKSVRLAVTATIPARKAAG